MIVYAKSLIAGALVAAIGALLAVIGWLGFMRVYFQTRSIGFHVSVLHSLSLWLFILAFFLAGFSYEFRRLQGRGR